MPSDTQTVHVSHLFYAIGRHRVGRIEHGAALICHSLPKIVCLADDAFIFLGFLR